METNDIAELIRRFNNGRATPDDVRRIEQLLDEGRLDLAQLEELNELNARVMDMDFPRPSRALDESFRQMLSDAKRRQSAFSWRTLFPTTGWVPRLAFASVLLLIGFAGGYLLTPTTSDDITAMREEMRDMKEMMVLSMLEQESPTERLKAVNLGAGMDEASERVTEALVQTLNNDENVNVRLAALDALKAYAHDSGVREELIRSISRQDSPLVQIALAETMVQLQEKSSVKALEKIIESEKTPEEVKKKIRESINTLI